MAFLLLCAGCARVPTAPATLASRTTTALTQGRAAFTAAAVSTGPTLFPVLYESGQFTVYWTNPDTNLWYAECSTNLVDWYLCGNECVYIENRAGRTNETNEVVQGLRFTETSLWAQSWFVRLRKR